MAILARRDHRQAGHRCEDPRCDVEGGRTDSVIYGDHIFEIRDGGSALDERNIMLRCALCHGRKTAETARRRVITRYRR
jgi:5-methylcytosine-specific restriction enzyme A